MWCSESFVKVVRKDDVVWQELGDGAGKNCVMVVFVF